MTPPFCFRAARENSGGSPMQRLHASRQFSASSRSGGLGSPIERESVVSISTEVGEATSHRISPYETRPPEDTGEGAASQAHCHRMAFPQ